MNNLTLEEIVARLRHANLSKVARATGLSRQYISGIASGRNTNPSLNVLKALTTALNGEINDKS